MVKRFYNNEHERAKWAFTQRFISKYLTKDDVVFEGFAGLGYITSLYLGKCKEIISVERDEKTYESFVHKFKHKASVIPVCADTFHFMSIFPTNSNFIQVIDLDPWGAAKVPLIESLRILKQGYILLTNTAPYWITERNMKLTWFGIKPPLTDWHTVPDRIFNEFIKLKGSEFGKDIELLDYYGGTRICRLLMKVK